MKFNLKTPCSNCPFRKDVTPYLKKSRAREISRGVTDNQGTFTCHKTLDSSTKQHCAGVLIMLEKIDQPNQMMRIAERFGDYKRHELNMEAPVFDSFKDFIKAQGE